MKITIRKMVTGLIFFSPLRKHFRAIKVIGTVENICINVALSPVGLLADLVK